MSRSPRRKIALRYLVFLAVASSISVAPPTVAREPLPEDALQRYVERFDREVIDTLGTVTRFAERRRPLPSRFEDAAVAHRRYWEALRIEASRLPEPRREVFLAKLRHLEDLVHNLELAVARGDGQGALPPGALDDPERLATALQTPSTFSDACSQAPTVGEGVFFGDTLEATRDGEASCGSSLSSPDVWYRFVAPRTDTFFVDTFGSDFDTVVSVHSGCPGTLQNELVCNDDGLGTASFLSFSAGLNQVRWIRVSGFHGASGSFTLRIGSGGGVRGRVTHAETGEPIGGATVFLLDPNGFSRGSRFTDPDGTYEFQVSTPGTYFAAATALDVLTELYDDVPCPGDRFTCDVSEGTSFEVLSQGVRENVDFALSPGATLIGHVREAGTGAAIPNANVFVFDDRRFRVFSALTESTGRFQVVGLPEGTYFARASSSEHARELYEELPCSAGCDERSGTPIVVQTEETKSGIDFTLDRLGGIGGRVTDPLAESGVGSLRIEVFSEQGSFERSALSDPDGNYAVEGLAPGQYFARVSGSGYAAELFRELPCGGRFPSCSTTSGTPIQVSADDVTLGIDFTPSPLGTIGGLVSEEATEDPVAFYDVDLFDAEGNSIGFARTSSTGEFTFSVAPGQYFGRTDSFFDRRYIDELYDDIRCEPNCTVTDGTRIDVGVGQDVSIAMALQRAGTVSGRVTDRESGDALAFVDVEVYDADGSFVVEGSSDSEGFYEVTGLLTGNYFVRTREFLPFTHRNELYDDIPCHFTCEETSGAPVQVIEGRTTQNIDFALDLLGQITGTVIDASTGNPIGNLEVTVRSQDGSFRRSDFTDFTTGEYVVDGLAAGTYFARTEGPFFSKNFADELYREKPCEPSCSVFGGDPVVVQDGLSTDGIDFTLDPRGVVQGRVTAGESGAGLESVRLEFYGSSGFLETSVLTDTAGDYRVQGLFPDTYFVVARPLFGSTRIPEVFAGFPCISGSCEPERDGDPVDVLATGIVSNIDFVLDEPSSLTVDVLDETTDAPLGGVSVFLFNSRGGLVRTEPTGPTGRALFDGLGAGSYFLTTSNSLGLLDELYDDLPCVLGGTNCSTTKGTPVPVPAASDVTGIEIRLGPRSSGITGVVRATRTRVPASSGQIHVWDENGELAGSDTLGAGGGYSVLLPAGTYFVSTDHGRTDVFEEVFDNVRCESGSAFDGFCDPTTGTPVVVEDRFDPFVEVDFLLDERVPGLFSYDFESGDLSGWSRVEGDAPPSP